MALRPRLRRDRGLLMANLLVCLIILIATVALILTVLDWRGVVSLEVVAVLAVGLALLLAFARGRFAGGGTASLAERTRVPSIPLSSEARLRRVEGKLDLLLEQAGLQYEEAPHPSGLSEQVRLLADGGNKIAAIKELRGETGLGLKEAKDVVEQYLVLRR